MSEFVRVGSKNDFPENRTTQVKVGETEICIAHTASGFTAFPDSCTHAQSALSGSPIEDGIVTCPLHGAKFDVTTGQAKSFPATEPVKMIEVKLEGENVLVKV